MLVSRLSLFFMKPGEPVVLIVSYYLPIVLSFVAFEEEYLLVSKKLLCFLLFIIYYSYSKLIGGRLVSLDYLGDLFG